MQLRRFSFLNYIVTKFNGCCTVTAETSLRIIQRTLLPTIAERIYKLHFNNMQRFCRCKQGVQCAFCFHSVLISISFTQSDCSSTRLRCHSSFLRLLLSAYFALEQVPQLYLPACKQARDVFYCFKSAQSLNCTNIGQCNYSCTPPSTQYFHPILLIALLPTAPMRPYNRHGNLTVIDFRLFEHFGSDFYFLVTLAQAVGCSLTKPGFVV